MKKTSLYNSLNRTDDSLVIGVLAGGKSRRYGRDKSLEIWKGKTLIEWTINTAQYLSSEIYIITKTPERYSHLDYYVITDKYKESTPLSGIITVYEKVKDWIILLPCDMPLIQYDVLNLLWNEREKDTACLFEVNGKLQPFLALYPKTVQKIWVEAFLSGQKRLMRIIKNIPKKIISEEKIKKLDPKLYSFININTRKHIMELNKYGK
jgi:molybdenum cofactor guanylyltransferase